MLRYLPSLKERTVKGRTAVMQSSSILLTSGPRHLWSDENMEYEMWRERALVLDERENCIMCLVRLSMTAYLVGLRMELSQVLLRY